MDRALHNDTIVTAEQIGRLIHSNRGFSSDILFKDNPDAKSGNLVGFTLRHHASLPPERCVAAHAFVSSDRTHLLLALELSRDPLRFRLSEHHHDDLIADLETCRTFHVKEIDPAGQKRDYDVPFYLNTFEMIDDSAHNRVRITHGPLRGRTNIVLGSCGFEVL